MTRTLLLCAAAATALTLAACNKTANTASNAADATGNVASSAADSAANATSGAASATGAAVSKAEDTTGAAVGATSAATLGSHDTAAFVSNAAQSDMYEIQAAKIAEERSKNPEIKAFAKMMVKDHTALSNGMKPLIKAAGQTPPTDLDKRRSGFLDHLKSASDADFDKTYIDQQVAGHQEALTLMQGYGKDGSDAGLKDGASKAAPKVQMHLDKAKEIQAKLSSSTK
ncbi:MAG: DUF4142 domain-containing protein [Phenylobacterium sp.]|nr:MAG: DUF4142 domain-containing protein [Phenylobacterium sp.]